MSTESHLEREGWERPRRLDQLDLFVQDRDRVLALAGVSLDEIERWRRLGWISFDAREEITVDSGQVAEFCFIRNLARSGLSDLQIDGMLAELSPPYRYDPVRTAYSFAFGWVQAPLQLREEERDQFIERHLLDWARTKVSLREDALLERFLSDFMVKVAEARSARKEAGG